MVAGTGVPVADGNKIIDMRCKMKRSGTTVVFVLVCAIVLVAAYGVGVCVREYRFRRAGVEPQAAAEVKKPTAEPLTEGIAKALPPAPASEGPQGMPSPGEGPGPAGDKMAGMRQRFENMSEEERQQAMTQMRDRVGGRQGRQREGMPQLSEEDRAKMREEMDALRARWDQMSEEERQEAQAQMREKYGFAPRGFGGDRGFGGGEGGRQRGSGPDAGQQENN